MHLTRRRTVLALAATLLVAGMAAAPAAARARGPASACTDQSGVVSVVDFTHWGGKVAVGCAPGTPATGLDVLHAAGFKTEGTQREGDAFVCRIDGKPTQRETPCRDTPPPDAYWAYYFALPGDTTWTYTATGAASRHPVPGSAEAWAFGADAKPTVTPGEVLAGPPGSTTTTSTAPPTTTSRASTTSSAAATTTSGTVMTSPPPASTTAPTSAPTSSAPPSTVAPATVAAASERTGTDTNDNSGPVPLVATAAIVGLLAVGATIVARRRRTP